MSKTYFRYKNCACCQKRLDQVKKKYINKLKSSKVIERINKMLNEERVKPGDLVCNNCQTSSVRFCEVADITSLKPRFII